MPHEVESMMYVKETPWHGLGHRFENAPTTVNEALIAAGLDWSVNQVPLFVENGPKPEDWPKGKPWPSHIELVGKYANVRDDNKRVLGVVGERYSILQNHEAFAAFQPFLDKKFATIETAGSLKEGRRIWVLAKINQPNVVIADGDEIARYFLLSHGHDGSLAIHVGLTPIRVVCANTEGLARRYQGSSLLKLRHTANANETVAEVADLMMTADRFFTEACADYQFLASKLINSKELDRFIRLCLRMRSDQMDVKPNKLHGRTRRRYEEIMKNFEAGPGSDNPRVRGTWWMAMNGANHVINHGRGRTRESGLDALWFGNGKQEIHRITDLALSMAQ